MIFSTASETNNEGFHIERSLNGTNWEDIGFVFGQGTSNELSSYEYKDPITLAGTLYYRLKQIDYDGQYDYSDIAVVNVKVENGNWFKVLNTVVRDELHWLVNKTFEEGELRIFTSTGVLNATYALDPAQANQKLSVLTDLPPSLYIVQALIDGQAKSLRFIQSN